MKQWIARLFDGWTDGELAFALHKVDADSTPVKVVRRKRFRVKIYRETHLACDECGRPMHWLAFEFQHQWKGWTHLLILHESNLGHVMSVLDDVANYLVARKK